MLFCVIDCKLHFGKKSAAFGCSKPTKEGSMPVAKAETTPDTQRSTKERVSITCIGTKHSAYFYTQRQFTDEQVEYVKGIEGVISARFGDDANYSINVDYGPAFEWTELGGQILYAITELFGVSVDDLDVQEERDILSGEINWLDDIIDVAKRIELEELEDDLKFIAVSIQLADQAGEILRELRSRIEAKLADS